MDDGIIGADDSYAFVGADVLVGTTDVCVGRTMGGRARIQRSPERAFCVGGDGTDAFRVVAPFAGPCVRRCPSLREVVAIEVDGLGQFSRDPGVV